MGPHPVPRTAAAAGIVAPVGFVTTFVVDGWLRPGYDPRSRFVSELSLGPGGWVQRASFLGSGALVTLFATAVPHALPPARSRSVATGALALLGVCLAASGVADTDPSARSATVTRHGRVHGVLGAVAFTAMPVSALAVARCLRADPGGTRFRCWSSVVGAGLVGLTLLLKVSELPAGPLFAWKGLVQRADLVLHLGWLATLAVRITRAGQVAGGAPGRRWTSPASLGRNPQASR